MVKEQHKVETVQNAEDSQAVQPTGRFGYREMPDAIAPQWANGGGLVADFPSDKAIALDGTVGRFSDLKATAATDPRARVFVSGDGMSGLGAMGLDEDLRLLIQAFVQGSRCDDRKTPQATPASDAQGDIEIALHGLNLAPKEEAELHRLIRALVRERLAGKEAAK
jgi:hypothetical protein